jgi:hypothetical protein
MITRIEKLGDRLLSLVVPHARASAAACAPDAVCVYAGVCDRVRDRWYCCHNPIGCQYVCSYTNPCP